MGRVYGLLSPWARAYLALPVFKENNFRRSSFLAIRRDLAGFRRSVSGTVPAAKLGATRLQVPLFKMRDSRLKGPPSLTASRIAGHRAAAQAHGTGPRQQRSTSKQPEARRPEKMVQPEESWDREAPATPFPCGHSENKCTHRRCSRCTCPVAVARRASKGNVAPPPRSCAQWAWP